MTDALAEAAPEFVDAAAIAAAFRVSTDSVLNLAHTGVLPFVKVGRVHRFDVDRAAAALAPDQAVSLARAIRAAASHAIEEAS